MCRGALGRKRLHIELPGYFVQVKVTGSMKVKSCLAKLDLVSHLLRSTTPNLFELVRTYPYIYTYIKGLSPRLFVLPHSVAFCIAPPLPSFSVHFFPLVMTPHPS